MLRLARARGAGSHGAHVSRSDRDGKPLGGKGTRSGGAPNVIHAVEVDLGRHGGRLVLRRGRHVAPRRHDRRVAPCLLRGRRRERGQQ